MTVSITDVLATLPSGARGQPLSWEEVGKYIRDHCDRPEDKDRQERHQRRDKFYSDAGVDVIKKVIDDVYRDLEVRELRKAWAPYARYNNAFKRIVNEVSTVYAEPAKRTLEADDDTQRLKELLDATDFDVLMQHVNRLYNAHYIVFVAPRVRVKPDRTRELVWDVSTPSSMRVVPHPNDEAVVVGYILRLCLKNVRSQYTRTPAWVLWTDHESVYLDDRFSPIQASHEEHGFGVCPIVPIVQSVGRPGFWPGEEGEDLSAGQVALAMTAVHLLKEQKTATKQTFLQGELAGTARAQAMDSELPAELGEGAAATTVDMSMDLTIFTGASDHILEQMANARGMSGAYIKHQGTQSAEARELIRAPLREIRRGQQPMFRRAENRLVAVLAAVLKVDWTEMAFDPTGFRVDFGEAQTPLSAKEELEQFELERRLGLTDTFAFMMRRNPDLDAKAAEALSDLHIRVETQRMAALMPLKKASGELGGAQAGGGAQPNPAAPPTTDSEDQAA